MTGWSNVRGLLGYLDLPVTRLRLALANLEDLALTAEWGHDELNRARALAAVRDLTLSAETIANTAPTIAQMTTAACRVPLTDPDREGDDGTPVEVD
jgi:hypothetical protein